MGKGSFSQFHLGAGRETETLLFITKAVQYTLSSGTPLALAGDNALSSRRARVGAVEKRSHKMAAARRADAIPSMWRDDKLEDLFGKRHEGPLEKESVSAYL